LTADNVSPRVLLLILSVDSEHFKSVQDYGQDGTFVKAATLQLTVVRYKGHDVEIPTRLAPAVLVKNWQHSLLHHARNRIIRAVVRALTALRVGDKALKKLNTLVPNQVPFVERIDLPEGGFLYRLITPTPEGWAFIGEKTLQAFKYLLENHDFDFIFRTNTSSYVDAARLLQRLHDMPKSGVYAGFVGTALGKLKFASGAGILLSRDVVKRICDHASEWKHGLIDDVALADLISRFDSPKVELIPLERLTLTSLAVAKEADADQITNSYHVRCKADSPEETIEIMRYVQRVKDRHQKL
jgi:hypothetical protein